MERKEIKEWKEKYGENKEVRNTEECIVLFVNLKQSKKERKLMATSY